MSNPMLRENILQDQNFVDERPMTINGTIGKTVLLLGLAFVSSLYTYSLALSGALDKLNMFIWGGVIVAFVACIACSFKMHFSKPLSIVYAVAEGFALGGISAMYNSVYEGIIIQAVVATMVTLFVMLLLYLTKILRATPTFVKIVSTATISIAIFYILVLASSVFNIGFLSPFQSAYSNVLIIAFITLIASLNLIRDFDLIERYSEFNAPSFFEWYGAMSLMVTLVWLYIEFLRLIAATKRR